MNKLLRPRAPMDAGCQYHSARPFLPVEHAVVISVHATGVILIFNCAIEDPTIAGLERNCGFVAAVAGRPERSSGRQAPWDELMQREINTFSYP